MALLDDLLGAQHLFFEMIRLADPQRQEQARRTAELERELARGRGEPRRPPAPVVTAVPRPAPAPPPPVERRRPPRQPDRFELIELD